MDLGGHSSYGWHQAATPFPTTLSNASFAACTFFTSCTLILKVPAFSYTLKRRGCACTARNTEWKVSLSKSPTELYVLSAREDHITPWRGGYRTTQLAGGPVRFVLTSSGHIAGIVNPPGPKRSHFTNEALPADPEEWLDGATEVQGSWWEDWAPWVNARGGERRKPPRMGSRAHPPLDDAPGAYVREP